MKTLKSKIFPYSLETSAKICLSAAGWEGVGGAGSMFRLGRQSLASSLGPPL